MSDVKMDANSIYLTVEDNESRSEIRINDDRVSLTADGISLIKISKEKKEVK